jgi:hypothetical protein
MKNCQVIFSVLWLTFFSGCLQQAVATETARTRHEENRAKVVVFRYLMGDVKSSDAPFILAIRKNKEIVSPSRQVIRWVGFSSFVKGASQMEGVCQQVRRQKKSDSMGFLPGVLCTIYGLKWITKDQIDVIGSSRFNPCGSGDVGSYQQDLFHLKRNKKNNWIVSGKFPLAAAG